MSIRDYMRLMAVCLLVGIFGFSASAIEYTFPAGANVVDITKTPYYADRTGKTDVSAILSKAANDIINASGWGPGILYLPNGTYLVKNTFAWRCNASANGIGPHVVGQSRKGTVIKLAKGTWPLGTEQKAVIQTGAGDENNFNKGIQNLTVMVDSNNAGAIGIIYVSDNNGLISDVDVVSTDGKGTYGILSSGGVVSGVSANGPFLIRRTYIKGFQVGMRACATQSESVSQIRLEGQSKYGIFVSCGNLTIDSLTSNDTVQAIEAQAPVMLTHGLLLNGAPTRYAIRNWAIGSYFNDVITSGYKAAITSVNPNPAPTTTSIAEYTPVDPVSLFSTAKTSMHLPARYPPEVAWETNFTKWAFPADYKTGGRTDVQALQAAIDDLTKTTICIPRGTILQIDQPVYVRGAINRIYGTGGTFRKVGSNGRFYIEDGTAPVVIMQKVSMAEVTHDTSCTMPIIKHSTRTFVLETSNMLNFNITGSGETYITDITSGKNFVDHPNAKVFLWQWEGSCCIDTTLAVRSGMVRSVGYYDEGWGSMIFCLGGFTEIFGYWDYNGCTSKNGSHLLTIANSANVSAAGVWQQNFCNPWAGYMQLVSETRNGTKRILGADSASGNVKSPAGSTIALFTAYDSAAVRNALVAGVRQAKPIAANNNIRLSAARTHRGIEVTYSVLSPASATLLAYDLSGRIISIVKERSGCAGIHRTLIPLNGLSAGIICVELRREGLYGTAPLKTADMSHVAPIRR